MIIALEECKTALAALEPKIDELRRALGIDQARAGLLDIEERSMAEGFWSDMEQNQSLLRQARVLKDKCAIYDTIYERHDELTALCRMAIEEDEESLAAELTEGCEALESELEKAHLATMLSGEYDHNNAIVSFHAGAGGTEAADWVQMLYRMITRWAERKGYSYKLLDCIDGDEAGIKSAVILVEGANAFGYLKSEMGVHRLVRISPFDASGRRHTSFAALEVMPEIDDDVKIDIREEDLKVDTYRSGGAGGQHVNKTESAVRITHKPTGIIVACQNERSQMQNRAVCMKMLRSKLVEIKEREHYDKVEDIKGEQKAIEWGSQIRSYVFMPYTLVKDHRTGFEAGNINAVMDGDLDGFMSAYLLRNETA